MARVERYKKLYLFVQQKSRSTSGFSYFDMKKGDRLDAEMADGSTVSSSLSKQAEDAGYEADFTVTPDGTEGSFSITDGDSDTGAKAEDSVTTTTETEADASAAEEK